MLQLLSVKLRRLLGRGAVAVTINNDTPAGKPQWRSPRLRHNYSTSVTVVSYGTAGGAEPSVGRAALATPSPLSFGLERLSAPLLLHFVNPLSFPLSSSSSPPSPSSPLLQLIPPQRLLSRSLSILRYEASLPFCTARFLPQQRRSEPDPPLSTPPAEARRTFTFGAI